MLTLIKERYFCQWMLLSFLKLLFIMRINLFVHSAVDSRREPAVGHSCERRAATVEELKEFHFPLPGGVAHGAG